MKKRVVFLIVFLASLFSFAAAADDDDLFGSSDSENDSENDVNDGVEDAEGEFDDEVVEPEETIVDTELSAEDTKEKKKESAGPPPGFKFNRLGVMLGGGMGYHLGDGLKYTKARFVTSFAFNFDHYFNEMFALALGLGIESKGARYKFTETGSSDDMKYKMLYLEVPVGVKMNIKNVIVGAGVAVDLALSGKVVPKESEVDVDVDWDITHRLNLSAKVFAGYQFEVAGFYLTPGVNWSMHLLNNLDKDLEVKSRFMNIMFCVSAQLGL